VEIHVLQGERELAAANRTLGKFHLVGLPSAPRGMPQVEVTFDIDANGILHVSAKDLATSKEQNITITASTGMSESDIQQMVKDAEMHMDEDKKKKEEVEVRNHLDNLVYGTEKTLNESKDKISADEVKSVEDALSSAREALKSGDVNRMRSTMDQVTKASHKLAEVLYKQTASQQQSQAGGGAGQQQQQQEHAPQGGRGSDDVVDVEFEDVKK
jgi:molecular chaperone DnaK